MMIWLLTLLFSISTSSEQGLWKVELFNGKVKQSASIEIQKQLVYLPDTIISRSDIKNIFFVKQRNGEPKHPIKEDVKNIIEQGLWLENKYPDAGGVIIYDTDEYLLRPDGTRQYQYHFAAKILKNSLKRWSTVELYFEEERSKINITLARTIKPDGSVLILPQEDIKIVNPKSGMVFFEKGKIVQFELPDVSIGDIIEYRFTEETFNPWNMKFLNLEHYFQTTEPIFSSSMQIAIPESQSLTIGKRNIEKISYENYLKNGYKYYYWGMKDIPPLIREQEMPPLGDIVPRIEVSNQKSWDAFYDWYGDFQIPRMKQTDRIKELSNKITEAAKTDAEKTAKLYHFVQRNVRYISIKGGAASGVSGHPAEETLEKGYGDCTDKAILFATLLRAVGIKAYPVYIGTNEDIPELMTEVPGYYGNHCIDNVEIDGKSIYLDATGTTSRYPSCWSADHDVYAVNAIKRQIRKTPIPKPEENERNYTYEINISSLDCTVTFIAHYTGDWEDWVRWYWEHKKKDEIKKTFEEMIHEISPYSELIDYSLENVDDISKPFVMTMKYKLNNYVKRTGDLLLFNLPELVDRYTFDEVGLVSRKYPLAYSTSETIKNSYTITFPHNLKVVYLPHKVALSNYTEKNVLFADYSANYINDAYMINFTDAFNRYARIILPASYVSYKQFLTKVTLNAKKKIIFEEEQ